MIDENKLLEALVPILDECGYMYLAGRIAGCIMAQQKISLENKTSDWISVEEALPRENEDVLVTERHKDTNKTFVNLITYYSMDYRNDTKFEIIAWMPLPKPYEVKDER